MNRIVLNSGLWSATICLAAFIVWIISFVAIAIQASLFFWTNMENYIEYVENSSQFFQYLAQGFMILFSLAYMVLTLVLSEFALSQRKLFAKIAIVFAIMFALVSSIHYFVQISYVRFAIANNEYLGLEHFLQSNPTSFLSSVNMLGWTLFLSLSTLFLYFGLGSISLQKGIRIGLLINTASCFLGGIGYLFQIDLLTFIFINLGVGLGFILITFSSIKFFLRLINNKCA
mgnify:CR=1 FL=1